MNSKIFIALSTLALFGCAQKAIQLKEVTHNDPQISYVPFDYIGGNTDGRIPAQAGGTALVKFVETLGPDATETTLKWVNGAGKKSLGLTRNVEKLSDLSAPQRINVLAKFAEEGSALNAMFSNVPNLEKSAESFMGQTNSYVTKAMLNKDLKGIPGNQLERSGFGPSVDVNAYFLKQSSPAVGKEVSAFAKTLKKAAKNQPALDNFGPAIIQADMQFAKTGERMLSSTACKDGAFAFSESVVPVITEVVTDIADDAVRALEKNGGKPLSDVEAGAIAIRSHKKVVTGRSCLGSFQAIKALSGNGACPLFGNKIMRGVASIKDLSLHCK
ncbi:MAG: hypothetical protein ACOYL6_01685 [Bacteriovoracaceae bacterium]